MHRATPLSARRRQNFVGGSFYSGPEVGRVWLHWSDSSGTRFSDCGILNDLQHMLEYVDDFDECYVSLCCANLIYIVH